MEASEMMSSHGEAPQSRVACMSFALSDLVDCGIGFRTIRTSPRNSTERMLECFALIVATVGPLRIFLREMFALDLQMRASR